MGYCIIWEFEVAPERRADFEAAYGPDGLWARLFRRAAGFVEVMLLRDEERSGIYFTLDRWASEAAFLGFKRDLGADYEALDRMLEGVAMRETRLGAFAEVV